MKQHVQKFRDDRFARAAPLHPLSHISNRNTPEFRNLAN
jgi:hypothetical protein